MKHCKKCGQDFEGNFCPNCGAVAEGHNKCPHCGAEVSGKFCSNCGYSVSGEEKQSKKAGTFKLSNSVAVIFLKKYWVLLLVSVLALVSFLTLMITLVGLRGIYVNVNNPNDFYDFDATSYRASVDSVFGASDELEEGKWKLSGSTLTLKIKDEDFGEISDNYAFSKIEGFKRVRIDEEEYKRVSIVGLKTTKQKLKITFDMQYSYGGEGNVKKVEIGSRLPSLDTWGLRELYNNNYGFLGWYTEPNGQGSLYREGMRVWENCTYYAYWCVDHISNIYESNNSRHWQYCSRCGKEFNNSSHYVNWITIKQPTCTLEGMKAYQCECGYKDDNYETRIINPTGHDYGDWIIDTEDYDCGDVVTAHRYCSVCTYRDVKDDYIAPHVYDEWIDDEPATCMERATHYRLCTKCGYRQDEYYGDFAPHVFGKWVIDESEYTCGDHVIRLRSCVVCQNYDEYEYWYIVPHDIDPSTKKCKICGRNNFASDDRLFFGEYPQTREIDNGIIATLSQMSGSAPVKGNRGKWIDYKYYLNGIVDEYMWYIDIEYNGTKYRGVYFTSYRQRNCFMWGAAIDDYFDGTQSDYNYRVNNLYWFKWEPIEWRVLENNGGEVVMMSNVILDSQEYQYEYDVITDNYDKTDVYITYDSVPNGTYANNYKYSAIRNWLNNTFYNSAFSSAEQAMIKTSLVDNSAATFDGYYYARPEYACENTNDNVFLLSYKDISDDNYVFNTDLTATDYAASQGYFGYWWLRSPWGTSFTACLVGSEGVEDLYHNGYTDFECDVTIIGGGVVPAIRIQL